MFFIIEIFGCIYRMNFHKIKLTKVHKILKFKHSDWLRKYIDFNADKRKLH